MGISIERLAKMIDISGVQANVTLDEIDKIVATAIKYHFICAFAMPCFTSLLSKKLEEYPEILIGGVVSFPSGAETTSIKIYQAQEMIRNGADELDMVINIGAMKSKKYDLVFDDICAVVEVAEGKPVKSIIEASYLTDYEIAKASEIAVKAGVEYVKTGTGWAKPTTIEMIKIIKNTIGDSAKIKAAGGIRKLDTILKMIDAGCSRFGLGCQTALDIMKEVEEAKD